MLTQEITYKSLNYNAFIPILISAVKEQDEKIDAQDQKIDSLNTVVGDLNNRLTQLENCLSGILPFLCQLSNSSIQQTPEMVQEQIRTAINVNLSDKNTIILDQNVPNPFAESTIITYSIPATVGKAQIHFYDLQGKLIKVVDINERGAGQLNVFGEDLSSGTYTYTLVADGQIVSTKKMVKE
jgi:flagellar hook assembly protein FlgD